MSELCLLKVDGPVATISLNRPDRRNAMSIELLRAAHARVDELTATLASADEPVKVVVIEGAGRAFCAGMDLKQVLGDPDAPLELLTTLAELTVKIRRLPAVVVAKVRGAAIGGGCGLTCVADVCVTHADCKMGFPEVDLGVCPAVVAPWLVRKIGGGRARSILLRGGLMSGADAHTAGIVDVCVADESALDSEVASLCERLAGGGAAALAATKGLLNELDHSLDESLARKAAALSAEVLATPEAQARLAERFAVKG